MRSLIAFFVGVLVLTSGFSQNRKSEKRASSSYQEFKSRSMTGDPAALLDEADQLKSKDASKALDKVQEALGLSIAQGDELTESKCYLLLGEINEGIQAWKLAFDNYELASQILSISHTATREYKRALHGLGTTSMMLDHYEDALKYLRQSIDIVPANKNDANVDFDNERLLDISEVYYRMGNYGESLKVLDGMDQYARTASISFSTRMDNQRAKINARLNESDKPSNLYQNALNNLRKGGKVNRDEVQSLQDTKEEIANVLKSQNKAEEEIDLRNRAIEFNLESKNMTEVSKDKLAIGKTLDQKGDTKAAIKEVEEAVVIADSINDPAEQANAFLALAGLYERNGKTSQALTAYRKYSDAVGKAEALRAERENERSIIITKQKGIQELTSDLSIGQREETIAMATMARQRMTIYGLLGVIGIVMVGSYFIYRNAQASKEANQLLALKSLRSQMNPHFIFNALNSVNHFIARQDERTANKFLSEFSQLMRLVMENSQEDFIPLDKEKEILSLYLKLEHYRFRDKFDYEIEIDKELNADAIEVPPMLIQPYIENAVWHGLRYKESKGRLVLRFLKTPGNLVVEITDDGIGRRRSAELKTENQKKHNSTGLKNIQQRLVIINRIYKAGYKVVIEDLANDTGTRVRITLPINRGTTV